MNLPCGYAVVHGGLQPSKSCTENKSKRHKGWEKVLITIPTQTWLTRHRPAAAPGRGGCRRLRGARDAGGAARGGTVRPRRATPTLRSNNAVPGPGPSSAAPLPAAHGGHGRRSRWYPAPLGSRLSPLSPSPGSSARRGASPRCSRDGDSPRPRSSRSTRYTCISDFLRNTREMNEISSTRKNI